MKASPEEKQTRPTRRLEQAARSPAVVDVRDEPVALRRRSLRRWYLVGGGVLTAGLLLLAFGRSSGQPAVATHTAPVSMDGHRIRFTEDFATRYHVASVQAQEGELSPTIAVMGTVRYDVRKFAAVGARSAGRVRRVLRIMGDAVKQGDILADIESVELGKAQAAAESLRAKELAAKTNLEREQQLALAKVTAMREAEAAKAEYEALRAERHAAEKAVVAMGAKLDSEVGIMALRSPVAGRVIMAKASRGLTVEPSDTLFEVADLSTVWVELLVFERDLDRVREGDAVEILPAAAEGEVVKGKLAHLGSMVDPETRSAVARVEVDNQRGWLRPGQSTSARIHTRRLAAPAITVPKTSVSFIDGKPTVLVLVSPGLVEPRHLELGPDDGERVLVRHGLRAGENVITEGLFALKSEIFR